MQTFYSLSILPNRLIELAIDLFLESFFFAYVPMFGCHTERHLSSV
jgi:hypothetical protein